MKRDVKVVFVMTMTRREYNEIMRMDMHPEDQIQLVNDSALSMLNFQAFHFTKFDPTETIALLHRTSEAM